MKEAMILFATSRKTDLYPTIYFHDIHNYTKLDINQKYVCASLLLSFLSLISRVGWGVVVNEVA